MASSPDQCSTKVVWEEASDVPHGYRFHLRSSVTLPVSADVLSVVAEGARFHGSLEVSQTANAGSDAIVEIDLFYHHEEDLDETTVCRLHPADNEWGLGIFTPHWRAPRNDHHLLRFHIHLRLPAVDSGSLLAVKELNTDLSNFSQDLRALADSVYFNRIALKSTNGHIEAGSVAGDGLRFQTTNAAIHGLIKTAYGLELRSTNGRINSQVVLLSNTSDALGGEYQVTAQTSNAHLELEFVDAPVDHVLTASARTSNGRADVALHETYEGSFEVHTSNAGRPIVRSRDVEDPAGRGRKRGVQVQTIRNSAARGKVWWEQENRDRGRVSVSTSNGRLQLTV
ncbi:hypothetical protein BD309DRAFT_596842 [Dichomitus squalens]|nr:hypothetical protein BD309DRAFT_596842 [Dichomitus squalens]